MSKTNKTIDFVLTKHIILNQLAQATLLELKDELLENNLSLYGFLGGAIEKIIIDQQLLHEAYKIAIPRKNELHYFEIADKVNNAIDKELLK